MLAASEDHLQGDKLFNNYPASVAKTAGRDQDERLDYAS